VPEDVQSVTNVGRLLHARDGVVFGLCVICSKAYGE